MSDPVSSGTVFLDNTASLNGGAVRMQHNGMFSHHIWTSKDDTFSTNVALKGSGGGMSVIGTKVVWKGTTTCVGNTALRGGGGCLMWEPLANSLINDTSNELSDVWKLDNANDATKSKGQHPFIEGYPTNTNIVRNNLAAYSPDLGTGPVALDAIVASSASSTKVSSSTEGSYLMPHPQVVVLDLYNHIVVGDLARDILVKAQLQLIDGGITKLSASTNEYLDHLQGAVNFTEMVISGDPGSGPHAIQFSATFDIQLNDIGGFRRTITTSLHRAQPVHVDQCNYKPPILQFMNHNFVCATCPMNSYLLDQPVGPVGSACKCNENYYSQITVEGEGLSCTKCPARSSSLKGTTRRLDCTCQHGLFQDATLECQSCPVNSILKQGMTTGTASAVCSCNPNYYLEMKDTKMVCTKCPSLSFSTEGSTAIEQCLCSSTPTKYVRVVDAATTATTCILCPKGSTEDPTTGQCVPCHAGFFKTTVGSGACTPCPINTWSNKKGATSLPECMACPVDRTTSGKIGQSKKNSCVCQKKAYYTTNAGTCQKCPLGGNCNLADGVELVHVSGEPGYWHSGRNTTVFSSCKKGYFGVDADKLAKERCCPLDVATNQSICVNLTLTDDGLDVQCKKGYVGPLCKICAKEHVWVGGECTYCDGGRNLTIGIIVLCSFCLPMIGLFYSILFCSKSASIEKLNNLDDQADAGYTVFGKIKIIIAFVQILASMPAVMDGVPWPKGFLSLTMPLTLINLDVLGLGTFASCNISLLFATQFVLHMSIPILLILSALMAYCLISATHRTKDTSMISMRQALVSKMITAGILFIYPGIATRVFTLFRCKEYDGVGGLLLEVDFTMQCGSEEHNTYMIIGLAAAFLCELCVLHLNTFVKKFPTY